MIALLECMWVRTEKKQKQFILSGKANIMYETISPIWEVNNSSPVTCKLQFHSLNTHNTKQCLIQHVTKKKKKVGTLSVCK